MLVEAISSLSDAYVIALDSPVRILSIYDDKRYDRSDFDQCSPAMRRYIVALLEPLGFKQCTGNCIWSKENDIKCLIPKSHALGASPFDITRYTPKRDQDFYILTPTQTACVLIERLSTEEAVHALIDLLSVHPINLLKIEDYLDTSQRHREFVRAIGYIKYKQRLAVEAMPLLKKNRL